MKFTIIFAIAFILLIPTTVFAQYMGNVGSEGQTGSYTLEEALEIQKQRIEDPEVTPSITCGSGTHLENGQCVVDTIPGSVCGDRTVMKDGKCVVDTSKTAVVTTEDSKDSKGGGCLIATATYGSELAPEVQKLREIRDNTLLTTQSGTSFIGTFNDFYYSFSPVIADYERENPVFREMVKLSLTPMLSTLSLMEYADSEFEVVSIGVSLIVLNGLMYVGIPAIVIVGIRKF